LIYKQKEFSYLTIFFKYSETILGQCGAMTELPSTTMFNHFLVAISIELKVIGTKRKKNRRRSTKRRNNDGENEEGEGLLGSL